MWSPHDLQWFLRCVIYAVLDRICSQSEFLSSDYQAFYKHSSAISRGPLHQHLIMKPFAKQTLQAGHSSPFSSSGSHKGYVLQQALSPSISFAAPTQVTRKCLSPLIYTYLNTNQPSPPILPRQRQSGYITSGA